MCKAEASKQDLHRNPEFWNDLLSQVELGLAIDLYSLYRTSFPPESGNREQREAIGEGRLREEIKLLSLCYAAHKI